MLSISPPLRALRLLLVEDNPGDAELIREEFLARDPPIDLTHARSLAEASRWLRAGGFDGVLLDLNLTDSQGLGTLDAVRAQQATVPVIVLAGSVTSALRAEAMRRGAAAVADKNEVRDRFFCGALLYTIERHRAAQRQEEICSLVMSSPDAIMVVSDGGVALFLNSAALDLFGRAEGEIVGELLHFSCTGPTELTIHHPRRGMLVGEVRVVPLNWLGERANVVSIRDVTVRKREEALRQRSEQLELEGRIRDEFVRQLEAANRKLAANNEALGQAKAAAEILVREVHHRVKNNLQIISSMLHLQAEQVASSETLEVFAKSSQRVDSIAKAHELLYLTNDLAHVDCDTYLRAVVAHLTSAYADDARVEVECDILPVRMPIDRAIACGLIVNELVTNAYKHAFPSGRRGTLSIELHRLGEERFELSVRDDGVGLSPDRGYSFGTELVETLAEQLEAELVMEGSAGTLARVRFSAPAQSDIEAFDPIAPTLPWTEGP